MGWPGFPGLWILGSRYKDGVRGWGLRNKEMSILDRAGSRDEIVEVLIVGLGGVGSKGLVDGPIRQLMVGLGKVVILVKDDSSVAFIGGENDDVGVGAERAECRFFGFGEIGSLWEAGRKFGIRDVS